MDKIDSFTFSLSAAKHSMKDLNLQIEAIENRISYISSKVEVEGIPVLKHILSLSSDEKELARLGHALVKIAPIVAELSELQKRKQIIDYSINKPEWMASTFADFSEDIEKIIGIKEED